MVVTAKLPMLEEKGEIDGQEDRATRRETCEETDEEWLRKMACWMGCSSGCASLTVSDQVRVCRPSLRLASSVHDAQQLGLEDELALLVLFRRLVGLVVLPPDRLAAATAHNVTHNVPARRHIALAGIAGIDIDHGVEQVRFAVLASEVLSSKLSAARVGSVIQVI